MVLEDNVSAIWYEDPDEKPESKENGGLVRIPTARSQITEQELYEINKKSQANLQ